MSVAGFTMHAGSRQVTNISIREGFMICQLVNPHPGNAEQFICFIFPKGHIVFRHTGDHTGTATGALVQINDHSEFFGIYLFHQTLFGLTIFD
jgi:hypothetical protein